MSLDIWLWASNHTALQDASPIYPSWQTFYAWELQPPTEDAPQMVKTANNYRTKIDRAIYRVRKRNIEPVMYIIKELLGFRQFSLRSLKLLAGE